jgi:hypothetical protein
MAGKHTRDWPYFLSGTPPCGSSPHSAGVENEVTSDGQIFATTTLNNYSS